jgi:ABC-type antimicrobial peptide transport system permease subunit
MHQGMILTSLGIAIGLFLVPALSRVLASFLHGLVKIDVVTYIAVSLLFLLVTLLACYLPSRRATNIDPAVALRYEKGSVGA